MNRDDRRMNAVEYRTFREACWQTAESASGMHGVNWRTVQKWDCGVQRPSREACEQLREMNRRIEEEVAKLLAQRGRRRKPARITLSRYRTEEGYAASGGVPGLNWQAHCAMLARALVALDAAGADVTLEWADAEGAAACVPACQQDSREDVVRI